MSQQNQFHEDSFCPVTCYIGDLVAAIKAAETEARRAFLTGVWTKRLEVQMKKAGLASDFCAGQNHFQVIHAAATGGRAS